MILYTSAMSVIKQILHSHCLGYQFITTLGMVIFYLACGLVKYCIPWVVINLDIQHAICAYYSQNLYTMYMSCFFTVKFSGLWLSWPVVSEKLIVDLLQSTNANAIMSPTPITEAISSKPIRHHVNFLSVKGRNKHSYCLQWVVLSTS